MCLDVNIDRTQRARRRKNPVVRYKRVKLTVNNDGEVELHSQHQSQYIWKPGKNDSGVDVAPDVSRNNGSRSIYRGIHTFTTKPEPSSPSSLVVIKVTCYPKDLIAVGHGDEVHLRVYLSTAEYHRVVHDYTKTLLKNVMSDNKARHVALYGPDTSVAA